MEEKNELGRKEEWLKRKEGWMEGRNEGRNAVEGIGIRRKKLYLDGTNTANHMKFT